MKIVQLGKTNDTLVQEIRGLFRLVEHAPIEQFIVVVSLAKAVKEHLLLAVGNPETITIY